MRYNIVKSFFTSIVKKLKLNVVFLFSELLDKKKKQL